MGGEPIPGPISRPVEENLDTLSGSLRTYLEHLGLPTENVLVEVDQRRRVITNLPEVVAGLPPAQQQNAFYLSKFVAACGAGLFDAALNFLWNEVISDLRRKVAQFDLEYFFDTAVTNPQERAKYATEDDLQDIEDWALVKGCVACGIISEIGYKHLDYVREMRNWASAAHPNQYQITGFQLIAWLETCLREVLTRPIVGPVLEVRRLLRNLREQALTAPDVPPIAAGVQGLPLDLAAALLRSAFGLYTDPRTDVRIKNNVILIAPSIWNRSPDAMRFEIGLKYSNFSANGDVTRRDLARQFLNAVDGLTYLPETELALEIHEKVDSLLRAHRGWDNFYNEIPVARELRRRIPENGQIPPAANEPYVKAVILCKIGRRSGVSRGARPYYDEMIQLFQDAQIRVFAKLLSNDIDISSRMQFTNCAANFRAIAQSLHGRTQDANLQAVLNMIYTATDPQMPNLGRDSRFQRLLAMVP